VKILGALDEDRPNP